MSSDYEHTFIRHVNVGDKFGAVYYLVNAYEKIAKNKKIYSDLTVRDMSGDVYVRYWGPSKELKTGEYVILLANVSSYNDKPQIVAESIENVEKPSDEDMDKYYNPVSEDKDQDIEKFNKYLERVGSLCSDIGDNTCKNLLSEVFTDEFKKIFFSAAASTTPFYGIDGGLLSHTVKTTFSVGSLASQYCLSKEETAVAVTSSLLHNIGSIESYKIDSCRADETSIGKLYGSKFNTLKTVNDALAKIDGSSEKIVNRIIHSIVSQDDCDVKPMTKEAIILSEMVKADLKIVSAINFIEQDINEDEFTAYDMINRQQYLK